MGLIPYALTIIGAAALALAFPGTNLWPLAWFAFVPFFMTLRNFTPRRSFWLGLLFGVIFYGVLLYWIGLFGKLPWILLILVQAAVVALFAAAASMMLKSDRAFIRVIGPAALWVSIEWLRSLSAAGFTWGSLAYSQAYNLPVARLAAVTGPWGVSFLLVLINAGLAEAISGKERRTRAYAFILPLMALIGVSIVGARSVYNSAGSQINVSLVQPSLPQMVNPSLGYSERQWKEYHTLTQKAALSHPDIIVWPESAMPDDIDRSYRLQQDMESLSKAASSDIIAGGVRLVLRQGQPREQNGAYVIRPGAGLSGRYFKVRLVPFGEYVPARKWLTIAKRYGVREIDYVPGHGWHPLESSFGKIGAVICFESIFPQISRVLAKRGAGILFVLTNDGWFEKTSAPEQHLQMSVFRAIENHRYVVRSASTGISALIAPDGRILKELGLWEKGILEGKVQTLSTKTIYNRFGDWLAYFCTAAVLVLLGARRSTLSTGCTKARRPL